MAHHWREIQFLFWGIWDGETGIGRSFIKKGAAPPRGAGDTSPAAFPAVFSAAGFWRASRSGCFGSAVPRRPGGGPASQAPCRTGRRSLAAAG